MLVTIYLTEQHIIFFTGNKNIIDISFATERSTNKNLNDSNNNITSTNTSSLTLSAAPISCFEYPCKSISQVQSEQHINNTNTNLVTALIGVGLNNVTLNDWAKNRDSIISYVDSAIDSLLINRPIGTYPCPGEEPILKPRSIICGIIEPPIKRSEIH